MKHRAVIGIEISGDQVRGACVRPVSGSLQLVGVASAPTPAGVVDGDGMLDAPVVGEAVRRVCQELDAKASHVVVGVTGCSLVARVMEIPPVPDSEIRSVLRGEMDHYRILPAGQSAFDYYRLPEPPEKPRSEPEEPILRVLLMGAEERLVASYRQAVDASGMNLVAVEPGSIALLRALFPMLRAEGGVASVIVTTTGTDIFITHNGLLQFYRRIDTGVPELRAHAGMAESAQQNTVQRGALLVAEEEPTAAAEPVREYDPYNRQAIGLLMTEVQRSIDFYVREFPAATESMLVRFAVDAPDATEMFAVMAQYLRTGAELASVMDTLSIAPEVSGELAGANAFLYTVAAGLALRGCQGYEGAPMIDLAFGDHVVVERRMAPRAMLVSGLASGLILLGTMAAAIILGNNTNLATRHLVQTHSELNALKAEHAAKVAMLDRQKRLTDAIRSRAKPVREAIDFLSASVSRRAALTSLALDENGQIYIAGEALTQRVVADVMDTINNSPVLDSVRLTNLLRLDPTGGEGYKFELQTAFIAMPPPVRAADANQNAGGKAQGG